MKFCAIRTTLHRLLCLNLYINLSSGSHHHRIADEQIMVEDYGQSIDTLTLHQNTSDSIPASTREYWMRYAINSLFELTGSLCPFAAFGSVIVNHTGQADGSMGQLICVGANQVFESGNPTLHGEIATINNCTTVLSQPPYNLSNTEISAAWKDLTLYTTAEACPMCATAIAWAGFSGYVYATSLWKLIDQGWSQTKIGSRELLARSPVAGKIQIVGGVAEHETDVLFGWQFQHGPCPSGCVRGDSGSGSCVVQN